MTHESFERAVLRELDQIRELIGDALREVRVDRERQDDEISELRLTVDRFARQTKPPKQLRYKRKSLN